DLQPVLAVVAVDAGGDRGLRRLAGEDQRGDLPQPGERPLVLEAHGLLAEGLERPRLLRARKASRSRREDGGDHESAHRSNPVWKASQAWDVQSRSMTPTREGVVARRGAAINSEPRRFLVGGRW